MADKKISELNSLTGANAADGDLVAIVDVSATETKKITRSEFFTDTPNIDVTGTVTADGLTVDVAGTADIVFQRDNAVSGKLELDFASAFANFNSVNDGLTFSQNAVKALQIRGSDISFYEDTGTTPKFFWDASTERLGIGTSSPSNTLQIQGNLGFNNAAGTQVAAIFPSLSGSFRFQGQTTEPMTFWTNNVQRMTIDSTGNVGIGTSSPTNLLDVNADSIRVRTAQTPATAGAAGNQGEIAWDANYIYICVATNTWKRVAISTW